MHDSTPASCHFTMTLNNMRSPRNLLTEERKQRAVELKKQGVPAKEIASELGVSTTAVHKYVRENQLESVNRRIGDGVDMINEVLNDLDYSIVQAKNCFRRSLQNRERVVTRTKGADGEEITRTIEGQCGDPRFLHVIIDACEKKCKLLGLYAPIKLDHGKIPEMLEVVVETRDDLITIRQIINGSNTEGPTNPPPQSPSELLEV